MSMSFKMSSAFHGARSQPYVLRSSPNTRGPLSCCAPAPQESQTQPCYGHAEDDVRARRGRYCREGKNSTDDEEDDSQAGKEVGTQRGHAKQQPAKRKCPIRHQEPCGSESVGSGSGWLPLEELGGFGCY